MKVVISFFLYISALFAFSSDYVWTLDSAEARQRVFEASNYRIVVNEGLVFQSRGLDSVKYYNAVRNGAPVTVFEAPDENGKHSVVNPGSVVFHLDELASSITRATFVLKNKIILKIDSFGRRSRIHISYKDRSLLDPVLLPLTLDELKVLPLPVILNMGRWSINWKHLLDPPTDTDFAELIRISREIREYLPELPDAEDGAMDKFGNLVLIETKGLQQGNPGFNCSGFAKWIADGLYFMRYNEFLSIDELKQKHPDMRGSEYELRYDDQRDPFFGLDWTRNIAWVLNHRWGSYEEYDVRTAGDFEYVEDRGFSIEDIEAVLYLSALENRETVYLGSINTDFGTNPVLNQHLHVVVFFPYFDENGRFRYALFERNVESSISNLIRRYPDAQIHLTKVSAEDGFQIISLE